MIRVLEGLFVFVALYGVFFLVTWLLSPKDSHHGQYR